MSRGPSFELGHGTGRRGTRPHRRSALVRLLLAVLLALPVLAGLGGPAAPPAAAAPAPGDDGDEDDGDREADRPVRIEITAMDSATVAPGGLITLRLELTNTGEESLTGLEVRLQRGEVLHSRADLLAADPDDATEAFAAFLPIAGTLAAGESLSYTYVTTTTDLALGEDGVYPVLLNLNGVGADGDQRRVGEVATYVVQQGLPPAGTTGVAWLWPLIEPTHRDAAGRFLDDDLADVVATGGRLDRALAAVERLPDVAGPGGGPQPVAEVTLAVDPALLEGLALMAEGPYEVGSGEPGEGTEAAGAFLDRLRAVAADHPVVALPYGDVDLDALTTAGLAEVAARTLPGTGTAAAVPALPEAAGPPVDQRGAGVRIVRAVLGVEQPRSDLVWAAGGTLQGQTLGVLRDGGVSNVVVSSTGLADGAAAIGLGTAGAAARTPLAEGTTGLVADAGLSALVTGAEATAGGTRVAAQRYLAELTLLARQPGGDPLAPRTVLIAPDRQLDADPDGMAELIAATAQVPGLRTAGLDELLAGPVADTGGLTPPAIPARLDPGVLTDVQAAVGVRDDIAGAVLGDADAAMAPYDAATARATSVAWRGDPQRAQRAAADLRSRLDGLLDEVTLLSPADGTYSLASRDAPLVLTVQNDLPFAVQVVLQVRAQGGVGLSVEDIGVQQLAPGERTTLQVPAEVSQSGRFTVTARLTTPDGGALGSPVELQVTSTAYGMISLAITIGAAALLGLLFLRRLVLFVLRRRSGAARDGEDDEPTQAPEGAAVPLPPTRSPV